MPRHLAVTVLLLACHHETADGGDTDTDAGVPTCAAPGPLDDVLSITDVQALGTHNSYHQQSEVVLDASWRYTQPPLGRQLAEDGVRQLELDLHLSLDGVFEVHHVPGDSGSSCPIFTDCLAEVKAFLDASPCALPVVVWMEPKDEVDDEALGYAKLDGHMREVDDAIYSVFPRGQVVTPDDVRGDHPDLPTAITIDGWPTLDRLRGRVLFSWLDEGPERDEYLGDTPNLEGRAMFADGDGPDHPWAAMFKIDDAVGEAERVGDLVRQGFLVTSNPDGPEQTRERNEADFAAALAAGPHFLSTNAPEPLESGYLAVIPGGTPARCNPVASHPQCTPEALEDLGD
jgi:hypothetical protein